MKVPMRFLPLPYHGIDFILSASSLRLMISQHGTIDGKNDKYACMREMFKKMNLQNAKRWFPLPSLAIDETLYPYQAATGFKQYNPKKLAEYGLF